MPVAQPESAQTVAAFEVPLPSPGERAEFLAIVRRAAQVEGLHVDADSDEDLANRADAIPEARMSIHAAVWRGKDDDESLATIMDQADHLGQVWIMFSKGEDQQLAERFRHRAMLAIKARWPSTLSLPIIDRTTIPLRQDLIRTPTGYRLNPAAQSRYDGSPAKNGG